MAGQSIRLILRTVRLPECTISPRQDMTAHACWHVMFAPNETQAAGADVRRPRPLGIGWCEPYQISHSGRLLARFRQRRGLPFTTSTVFTAEEGLRKSVVDRLWTDQM